MPLFGSGQEFGGCGWSFSSSSASATLDELPPRESSPSITLARSLTIDHSASEAVSVSFRKATDIPRNSDCRNFYRFRNSSTRCGLILRATRSTNYLLSMKSFYRFSNNDSNSPGGIQLSGSVPLCSNMARLLLIGLNVANLSR
jgi:hypothetical protein